MNPTDLLMLAAQWRAMADRMTVKYPKNTMVNISNVTSVLELCAEGLEEQCRKMERQGVGK